MPVTTPWKGASKPGKWEIGGLDWIDIGGMNPKSVLIATYGDSLSTFAPHVGWPAALPGSYVVNMQAVNGELGYPNGWARLAADAGGLVENVVVAMWGTNDLTWGHVLNDTDWLNIVLTPYEAAATTAVAACAAARQTLILMVPPLFGLAGSSFVEDSIYATRRNQIKAFYVASFPTVPLIDLSASWDQANYLLSDGIHLSSAGRAYVAGLVQAKVATIYPWAANLAAGTGVPINLMVPDATGWTEAAAP